MIESMRVICITSNVCCCLVTKYRNAQHYWNFRYMHCFQLFIINFLNVYTYWKITTIKLNKHFFSIAGFLISLKTSLFYYHRQFVFISEIPISPKSQTAFHDRVLRFEFSQSHKRTFGRSSGRTPSRLAYPFDDWLYLRCKLDSAVVNNSWRWQLTVKDLSIGELSLHGWRILTEHISRSCVIFFFCWKEWFQCTGG